MSENESNRMARVLEIVELVSHWPQRYTRKSLAEKYDVTIRTISNDMDLIKNQIGLNVQSSQDGYYFTSVPHLPPAEYTFSEAVALLTAARSAQLFPGINSVELAAAVARLEGIFPEKMHPILREAVRVGSVKAERTHRQEMLTLMNQAICFHQKINILYRSPNADGVTERVVCPYYLMPYGRSWQVIAYDELRGDMRQFKVDRIESAELKTELYDIPEDFDLNEYLGDNWGAIRDNRYPVEDVEVLFDEQAGLWVSEEQWHKSQQIERLPDGRVRFRCHVGVTPEMVNWLLNYGVHVESIHPEWLRDEVIAQHRQAANKLEEGK